MTSLLIDVSNNNGAIDWEAVARADVKVSALHSARVEGAYVKASEGTLFRDPDFHRNRTLGAAVMHVGAYHFARFGNVEAEAHAFLEQMGDKLLPFELQPALDVEVAPPAGVDAVEWCRLWCRSIYAVLGAWPLVYTNQATVETELHTSAPIGGGLWYAHPGDSFDSGRDVPASMYPWKRCKLRQFDWAGTVAGIEGNVDLDATENLSALVHGNRRGA